MARPRSDIAPRIVEAARARFLEHGVDGASLREIAREANTNLGMIVYYFPTKDDLFLAVVEEPYASLLLEMERLLGEGASTRERLQAVFARLGNATPLEVDVIRLVLREALGSSTRLEKLLRRFLKGHVPLVLATIEEGLRRGELDARLAPVEILLAVFGLGGFPQFARHALRSSKFFAALPSAEALAALSATLLFRAVGARK